MSEIDKAIKYWKAFKQEAIDMIKGQEDINGCLKEQIPMCEVAIKALEEKQQREQGCEHCKPTLAFGIIFDQNRTPFEPISMNFCPFCGRRLNRE